MVVAGDEERMFSTKLACPDHGVSIEEMEPRTFSFNNPHGACPTCKGLGFVEKIDPELVVVDPKKSIEEGAIGSAFGVMKIDGWYRQMMDALARDHKTSLTVPYEDMPESFKKEMLFGTGKRHLKYKYHSRHRGTTSLMDFPFEGVVNALERRYAETTSTGAISTSPATCPSAKRWTSWTTSRCPRKRKSSRSRLSGRRMRV